MRKCQWFSFLALVVMVGTAAGSADDAPPKVEHRFDFGTGPAAPGFVKVTPSSVYTKEAGFGLEPGSQVVGVDRGGPDRLTGDFLTGSVPFSFSVAVPEGNYRVKLTLGDSLEPSTTTVKAESRRLMLEGLTTEAGKFARPTFTVNVRTSAIGSGGQVKLKTRERGYLHWDDKLTLEFNDVRPCVCAVEIERIETAVTVYLAGDSTVTDQPNEPWNSWGQMLPRFFDDRVAVANHAESGESLKSSLGARRFDKIFSQIKPGDYLFIQFGHNDQKEKGPGVGALTTYKDSLKKVVEQTRKHGGLPVLVTPVSRRAFGPDGKVVNNLGDYPVAVRQVAAEMNVSLVDLNAMSKPFYESLGVEGSKQAFVDNTHHNNYGSYELARAIVEQIRRDKLDLARFIRPEIPPFDPAHPDPVAGFRVPASPKANQAKPDGN